ncbi:MAG: hypothetical protein HQM10_15340 [Candidatus Riflebacteria bacterium]|nr:hypothetical protein [Candidatus Riflebacteria bacterium]
MKENYSISQKKTGTALPLVLIFSSLMLSGIILVYKMTNEHRFSVRESVGVFQAKLMAMSGVQHLLLKTKLMPSEFYDAWAMAKGRNPYFDFDSSVAAGPTNPGPRFLTRGTPGANPKYEITMNSSDNFSSNSEGWFSSDAFAGKKWPTVNGVAINNSELYLWKFIADVTNKAAIQPVLAIQRQNKNFNYAAEDPYSGIYEVTSISLLGQKQGKAYLEDTVKIEVTGQITNLDGVYHLQTISQTVLVKRR